MAKTEMKSQNVKVAMKAIAVSASTIISMGVFTFFLIKLLEVFSTFCNPGMMICVTLIGLGAIVTVSGLVGISIISMIEER